MLSDSQSVKTPAFTGEAVGYGVGKKVKGRKWHLLMDSRGNVMAAGVTAALVHDKAGALTLKDPVKKQWH